MKHHYSELATTDYGNVLSRDQFMEISIRPLYQPIKRISGPAYTVQLASGDHLMLHAAIYEAPKGSIIVVDGVDCQNAVAGGNVCAIAKNRGIKGFVIDGVIRDIGEITEMEFPVFARGVFPVPGKKLQYFEPCLPVKCGGVRVFTGDTVVADIEGIAVLPTTSASDIYLAAKAKADMEAAMSLADWESEHRKKIQATLASVKNASH